MSSDILDFENVPSGATNKTDISTRSVQAKAKERQCLASDIEAFLASGGQIKKCSIGASAEAIDRQV